jgi:hypothetical protein
MTDLFGNTKGGKKKKQTINSFEALRPKFSVGETVDSLDMFKPKALGEAAADQLKPQGDWAKDWLGLGGGESTGSGHSVDMQPGIAYTPGQAAEQKHAKEQAEKAESHAEAAMDYSREIIHAGEKGLKAEKQESSQKIQMLIEELGRLAKSVQQIEKAMILQAIDPSASKKTGKYYESFFEWMLIVVQDARRKVEDSGAWMAMSSKKGKGASIHKTMKTNMQVGMSGERTNANNTG